MFSDEGPNPNAQKRRFSQSKGPNHALDKVLTNETPCISMDGSSRRCLADMRLVAVVQIDHDGGLMPIELDVQRTIKRAEGSLC